MPLTATPATSAASPQPRLLRRCLRLGKRGARRLVPWRLRAWLRALQARLRQLAQLNSAPPASAPAALQREPAQEWAGVPRVPAACGLFRVLHVIKPGADAATTRYRTWNLIEALGEQGVEVGFLDVDELGERLHEALAYDLIVLMRRPATPAIHRLLDAARLARVPVVFDIDDYVFDREAMPYFDYMKWFFPYILGYRETLDRCFYFTGSTPVLVEHAQRLGKKSYWIRNGLNSIQVELARQVLQERAGRAPDQRVRLGYFSGSICHQGDFRMISEVLVRLLHEHPELELLLAGHLDLQEFPELDPFRNRIDHPAFVDWRDLLRLTASVDINLAPTQSNPVYDGKSDLKYFEAALVKVPSVCSPMPMMEHSIRHGHNGLIARSTEEWYRQLKRLITEPDYRRQLAENAHAHVLAEYTPPVIARQALDAYRGVLTRHHPGRTASGRSTVVVLLSDTDEALRLGYPALTLLGGLVEQAAHVSLVTPPGPGRDAAALARMLPGLAVGVGGDVPCCDLLLAGDAAACAWAHAYRRRAGAVRYLVAGAEAGPTARRLEEACTLGVPLVATDPVLADWLRRRYGCAVELLPAWNRPCPNPPATGHTPTRLMCWLEPGWPRSLRGELARALGRLRRRQPGLEIWLGGGPETAVTKLATAVGCGVLPGLPGEELLALRPLCLFACGVAPPAWLGECQAAGCVTLVTGADPSWEAQAREAGAAWAACRAGALTAALEGLLVDPVAATDRLFAGWDQARRRPQPAEAAGLLLRQACGAAGQDADRQQGAWTGRLLVFRE